MQHALVVWALASSALFGLGLGACAANHTSRDVGTDGPDGGPPNGGPCWGNTVCDRSDPRVVRSCAPGTMGDEVAVCDETSVCSLGSCTSPSCASLRTTTSIAGCLFYVTALDNVDSDDAKPTMIVVTNAGDAPADVRIEERAADQTSDETWARAQSVTVAAGSAQSFTVTGAPLQGSLYGAALARRVVSDAPITVLVVQSDDANHDATSSSGTLLLPDHALDRRYMAITYQQMPTARMADMPGARDGAGEIAIVATADYTTLTISRPGAPPDAMPAKVTLERDGDVYQIVSENDGDNLTGTLIEADKPIAVFSGNVVTAYGQEGVGISSPDMAMEQMLPIAEWSRTYVAALLLPQSSVCNSLFPSVADGGPPVGTWQIVAERRATLTFTAQDTIQGLPPQQTSITPALPFPLPVRGLGDFVVHSNVPIMMTQGMDCEATLSSAVPADAPLGPQLLALVPNFEHELAIVRRDDRIGTPVLLDDEDIGGSFVPIGDGFSVTRRRFPACAGPIDKCLHRLTGAYGLTLRGMDVACSYAVTPATWSECRNGGDPCL